MSPVCSQRAERGNLEASGSIQMASTLDLLGVFADEQPSLQGLTDAQWAAWAGDLPRDWHGLWMRFAASGKVLNEMQASRSFVLADNGSEIHQSNTYGDREYLNSSGTNVEYRQETTGVQTKMVFGKGGNKIITTRAPIASSFFLEMLVQHPSDSSVRFSIFPIFLDGQLNRVSLIREVDVLQNPVGHFWKFDRGAEPAFKSPRLDRGIDRFHGTESSISADFRESDRYIDWRSWSLNGFLEIDHTMSGLHLPEGITFWFPVNLLKAVEKHRMVLSVLWRVDTETTIARKAVYHNGLLTRASTAILFHKH